MVGSQFKRLPSLTFFGDSSSRDDSYMVVGGFAVGGQNINRIESKISALRESAGIKSEFHWKSYKGGRRKKAYFELVNFAFKLVRNKNIAFHVMLVPFKGVDHKSGFDRKKNASANARKDETINKMYIELLLHKVAKFYGNSRSIQVILDKGDDASDILKRSGYISSQAYKKWNVRPNSIRSIKAMDSKDSSIIQMADVIVGGIAASRNERKLKQSKSELRDHILHSSGRESWRISTSKNEGFLTVWNHSKDFQW